VQLSGVIFLWELVRWRASALELLHITSSLDKYRLLTIQDAQTLSKRKRVSLEKVALRVNPEANPQTDHAGTSLLAITVCLAVSMGNPQETMLEESGVSCKTKATSLWLEGNVEALANNVQLGLGALMLSRPLNPRLDLDT